MPNGAIDSQRDYVADLAKDNAKNWPTIVAAQCDAVAVRNLLQENLRQFTSDDYDIIVFGSLARREWTSGSDVDWTMLVDGQACADHQKNASKIKKKLKDLKYKGVALGEPGTEGIFGNMAFSHDIVHHIGGQADTNRNTTQRILLLLEAVSLKGPSDELGPCERVVRQILDRYLVSDSNFHTTIDDQSRIPRFLLNDIVRYWRTMCVDFAYKDWEQSGRKWALRNIKLRTSRKMMFIAGLLMVFSCFQNNDLMRTTDGNEDYLRRMQIHLLNFVHSTPLNIIVWTFRDLGLGEHCVRLLDAYEQFLAAIDNPSIRDQLTSLDEKSVYEDQNFLNCREISHRLQEILMQVFFKEQTPLREFTFEYGLF